MSTFKGKGPFWQHVQPYGEVRLDVAKRLSLGGAAQAPEAGNPD
ncbi:hypothetical protein ACIA8R_46085 [Nonomuraea sp. NPDC051191]